MAAYIHIYTQFQTVKSFFPYRRVRSDCLQLHRCRAGRCLPARLLFRQGRSLCPFCLVSFIQQDHRSRPEHGLIPDRHCGIRRIHLQRILRRPLLQRSFYDTAHKDDQVHCPDQDKYGCDPAHDFLIPRADLQDGVQQRHSDKYKIGSRQQLQNKTNSSTQQFILRTMFPQIAIPL